MPKYVTLEWEEWNDLKRKAELVDAMNADGVNIQLDGKLHLRIQQHWTRRDGLQPLVKGDEEQYDAVELVDENMKQLAIYRRV